MLFVGPDLFAGKSPATVLVFGRGPMNLGPMAAGWVFLGHESLTTTFIVPSTAELSYINAALGGECHPVLSAIGGSVNYVNFGQDPDLRTINIDDVATKHVRANGAEVKQWQQ